MASEIRTIEYAKRRRCETAIDDRARRGRVPGDCAITLSALLLLLILLPPRAHAEIYRCSGKAGIPVYQNFPCEFDRLAAVPSNAANAVAPSGAPRANTQAAVARANPSAAKRSTPAVPRVGMTTEEVRAVWGEPKDMNKQEFARKEVEIWSYADSRSIEFDHRGRVTVVHW